MPIAKIEHIGPGKKVEATYGTVYYYRIRMDNKDEGSIGRKKEGDLSVGQELDYTLEINDKGNKIVLNKKEFGAKGFTAPSPDGQILMAAATIASTPQLGLEDRLAWTKVIFTELKKFLSEQK